MLLQELFESKGGKTVIFVFGPPAAGKSTAAEKVIQQEKGYTLVDADVGGDATRNKFSGYNWNVPAPVPKTDAQKDFTKTENKIKKLFKELLQVEDVIDQEAFDGVIKRLIDAGAEPKMTSKIAKQYGPQVGQPGMDLWQNSQFKKMADYDDPMDYVNDRDPNSEKRNQGTPMIVGNEMSRRAYEEAIAQGANIVVVETGGKAGIQNRVKKLQEAGYTCYAIFVALFPEMDMNNPEDFKRAYKEIMVRQRNRKRQLDPTIIQNALRVSQETKTNAVKGLPGFESAAGTKVEYIDTGVLNQEQSAQRTREIMKGWGL